MPATSAPVKRAPRKAAARKAPARRPARKPRPFDFDRDLVIEPVTIGPTWQRGPDGRFLLPAMSLGWHSIAWAGRNLQLPDGTPWQFTGEQFRWWLWWYSGTFEDVVVGSRIVQRWRFTYPDGVLQRLKGWGKDPIAAVWSANEFVGPCRASGDLAPADNPWGIPAGQPLGVPHPEAWVQIAAVAQAQTQNTMRLFPGLFTPRAKEFYGLRGNIGKEKIYSGRTGAMIEAVTSSPETLEGGRPTAALKNETQHWTSSNSGHELEDVFERNAVKAKDAGSRRLALTNAWDPTQNSVAQQTREAYDQMAAGLVEDTRLMYDSLEAPTAVVLPDGVSVVLPDGTTQTGSCDPLQREVLRPVLRAVRGDSTWLDIESARRSILDIRNAPSRSKRFWLNMSDAPEAVWADLDGFRDCAAPDIVVRRREPMVLFLDCSKSNDATALMACRLSDGHAVTVDMWQRPPKARGEGWLAPRDQVDARVSGMFDQHQIVAFFADPSHALDDERRVRYWDGLIDDWHRRYKARLKLWARPGERGHAVMFDMTVRANLERFVTEAELTREAIVKRELTHDDDPRLRIHVRNAREYPTDKGMSLGKEARGSKRKVDLAVAWVGARMLRRLVLNADGGKGQRRTRTGKVW